MEFHAIDIALHLVNIVVLYFLLRMWVFKPVRVFMSARQERVKAQMADAKETQASAKALQKELTAKLSSVQETCDQIVSESRQKGSDAAQKIIDAAETKAHKILDDSRQVAQTQRQQILDSAKVDLADIAITMAERVLKFDQALLTTPVEEKAKTGSLAGVLKTAVSCDDDTIATITNLLENLLGVHLTLSAEVDETLLGGFAAFVDGQVYDFSYSAQLATMKQSLN
ncbi:MAG: F0F1 ATP synthase subunit delta [Eubacteriales bacterium]